MCLNPTGFPICALPTFSTEASHSGESFVCFLFSILSSSKVQCASLLFNTGSNHTLPEFRVVGNKSSILYLNTLNWSPRKQRERFVALPTPAFQTEKLYKGLHPDMAPPLVKLLTSSACQMVGHDTSFRESRGWKSQQKRCIASSSWIRFLPVAYRIIVRGTEIRKGF